MAFFPCHPPIFKTEAMPVLCVVLGAPANCTTAVIKVFIVYQNQWTSYQMLLGNKILTQFNKKERKQRKLTICLSVVS